MSELQHIASMIGLGLTVAGAASVALVAILLVLVFGKDPWQGH